MADILNFGSTPEKVGKGISYMALMQVIDLSINLIFYAAIGRLLSSEGTGKVAMAFLIMSAFNVITIFALNTTSTRFIASSLGRKDISGLTSTYRSVIRAVSVSSTVAFAVSLVLLNQLSAMTGLTRLEVLFTVIAAFIMDFTSVLGGVLFGLSMYKQVAVQNLMYYSLSRLPGVLLAIYMGPLGVMLALALGDLPVLAYTLYALRGKIPAREKSNFKALMNYGWPLYLLNLLAFVQGWLATISVYTASGMGAMGTYYMISSLVPFLSIAYTSITSAVFPALSFKAGEAGSPGLSQMLRTSEALMLYLVAPMALSAAAASPTLLYFVYGPKYSSQWLVFSILSISIVTGSLSSLYSVTLQALGRTGKQLIVGSLSLVVNIVSLLALVPMLSAVGAALATGISSATGFLYYYYYVKKYVNHTFSLSRKLFYLWSVTSASVLTVQIIAGNRVLLTAGGEICAFFVSFLMLTKFLRPLGEEEKKWLSYAFKPKSILKLIG